MILSKSSQSSQSIQRSHSIDFLTTGIGRGHLFYLTGLHRALREKAPELCGELTRVQEVADPVSRYLWRAIEGVYRFGSRSGVVGRAYNSLRRGRSADGESVLDGFLSADLVSWARRGGGPLIVDHPLLASLLRSVKNTRPLIYFHGELVAPQEALSREPDLTVIPRSSLASRFVGAGAKSDTLFASGLCVELSLIEELTGAYESRLRRLEAKSPERPLTGAFFSSGAEPREHCQLVFQAALSAIRAGGRAFVFAKRNGRLERVFAERNLDVPERLQVLRFSSIPEEEELLAPLFRELDYYLAPAHERTNWAVGGGLPFFWLEPHFGSFAPLNAEVARTEAGGKPIASMRDAKEFGQRLREMSDSGELKEMNRTPHEDVGGFEVSADEILRRFH